MSDDFEVKGRRETYLRGWDAGYIEGYEKALSEVEKTLINLNTAIQLRKDTINEKRAD